MSAAVCYAASGSGYLFPTVVSASQARAHLSSDIAVYVVYFAPLGADEREYTVFSQVCRDEGVVPLLADADLLQGLGPTFARFFLDLVLPPEVDRLLYLDGDTQVVGDLSPLLEATPSAGGALAALDPMVFIHEVDRGLRRSIDRWWDSSAIPKHLRGRYVNSGMLRIDRSALRSLRSTLLSQGADLNALKFLDQDAVNLALDGSLTPVSMGWNFPGFLLGTPLEVLCAPRVVHFMSNPRPWNAPLEPWGQQYFEPYVNFAERHPQTKPYWRRLRGLGKARYLLQQRYKRWTEGRIWASEASARVVGGLERDAAPV